MVDGQHHTVSPQYLHQYATHAAWIEDNRRLDNGALANRVLGLALKHPVSRQWKGYWQRGPLKIIGFIKGSFTMRATTRGIWEK